MPSNDIDPVLVAVLRLSTFAAMVPVNSTPPNMNASGTPDNGMEASPAELVKVIGIRVSAATVAVDMNVMTKGWQEFAFIRLVSHVGNETAVTWYPEMGPVAPVPTASRTTLPALVTTVIPSSVPSTAAFLRVTPEIITLKVAAFTAAVPVNTNRPSVKDTLYPVGPPMALKPAAAVQPTAPDTVKKSVGQPIVIVFKVASQPAVPTGRLVAVVNVKVGVTAVFILRLADGIVMDTAVTLGTAVPTVPESVHTME